VTLLLGDADIQSVFGWRPAITALRAAYAAADGGAADHGARYPARSIARGDGGWLRVLSGVPGDGTLMGAKIIAAALRAGRVSYLIALFDLLASPGPLTVGVLGSGFEARKHLHAIAAVRELGRGAGLQSARGKQGAVRQRARRPARRTRAWPPPTASPRSPTW
jgi:alanine dehydrogenase